MKKFTGILIAVLLLMAFQANAQSTAVSSGLQTSDAAVVSQSVELTGALIITDGTNDATLIVYRGTSAVSGQELFKGVVKGTAMFGGATYEIPISAPGGIYADINGTGAAYIIYYRQ